MGGNYTVMSNDEIDTYGTLYSTRFRPWNHAINLITYNDDEGHNVHFLLNFMASNMMTFILVVTTYSPNILGTFSITGTGPALISFSGLNVTNSLTTAIAPDSLARHFETGTIYKFLLTGSNIGTIWGTMIYTDDSILAVAAVHSGFVRLGETCEVNFKTLGPQDSYEGTNRNGIDSIAYGPWFGSYTILEANCGD